MSRKLVDRLTEEHLEKKNRHHEIYKALFNKATDKILLLNSLDLKQAQFILSHREFTLSGMPLVDVTRATKYVFDKLVYHGFSVTCSALGDDRILHITWLPSQDATLREKFHTYRSNFQATEKKQKHRPKKVARPAPPTQPEPPQTELVDIASLGEIANQANW